MYDVAIPVTLELNVRIVLKYKEKSPTLITALTNRYLKSLGVTIYFEKENLDTANEETEFRLTMLESHAQEESISISKNIRLGEHITLLYS